MAGKGDKQRPCDLQKYRDNFDEIDWSVKWDTLKDEKQEEKPQELEVKP